MKPHRSRATPFAAAVAVAALGLAGCAERARSPYAAAVLPTGLSGPRPEIRTDHATPIDPQRVELTRQYLEIHDPPLYAKLPPGDTAASISFVPRMVVVHWTAIPTLEGTFDAFAAREIGSDRPVILANGKLNVGIQFVVDRDGTIYSLYPETVIARHVIGLNPVAIGIENVADGGLDDASVSAPLTDAQLRADIALVRYLGGKYPTIKYLIGHMEYREVEDPAHPAHALFYEAIPTYRTPKDDPGPKFLAELRRALRASVH